MLNIMPDEFDDLPYDYFPEDDGSDLDDFNWEEGLDDDFWKEGLDDDFWDAFPEEGDWEDEEEVSILNGD